MSRRTVPWRLRFALWHRLHLAANRLAWRYGLEPGWRLGMRGSAKHIRHTHWTWRLNQWAADHYIPEHMARAAEGTREPGL